MDQNKIYVKSEHDKVYLSKSLETTSRILTGKVILENLTDKTVLYKVLINKAETYSANPANYYILPKQKTEILIKRFEDTSSLKGDLILIQACPTDAVISGVSLILFNIKIEDVKKNADKIKMKNEGQQLYLEPFITTGQGQRPDRMTVSIPHNKETMMSDIGKTLLNNQQVFQSVIHNDLSGIEGEEELKSKLDKVKKDIESVETSINKVQNSLNALRHNITDTNKKKISQKGTSDKQNSVPTLLLLVICMIGLLIGAYLNK